MFDRREFLKCSAIAGTVLITGASTSEASSVIDLEEATDFRVTSRDGFWTNNLTTYNTRISRPH
ncbi:hypothetical protein BH20ACI2_BH20ACI2_03810 [soil metagenome]